MYRKIEKNQLLSIITLQRESPFYFSGAVELGEQVQYLFLGRISRAGLAEELRRWTRDGLCKRKGIAWVEGMGETGRT